MANQFYVNPMELSLTSAADKATSLVEHDMQLSAGMPQVKDSGTL